MASLIKEFKSFINRGSVLDLAVGVIIGAAFGKIINSLVNDIIMPPIGMLLGKVNFSELKATLADPLTPDGKPITINYGNFIQVAIEFLIIAFVIFLVVKAFNSMKKKEEAAAAPPPSPSENLLTEIRDLLKK